MSSVTLMQGPCEQISCQIGRQALRLSAWRCRSALCGRSSGQWRYCCHHWISPHSCYRKNVKLMTIMSRSSRGLRSVTSVSCSWGSYSSLPWPWTQRGDTSASPLHTPGQGRLLAKSGLRILPRRGGQCWDGQTLRGSLLLFQSLWPCHL